MLTISVGEFVAIGDAAHNATALRTRAMTALHPMPVLDAVLLGHRRADREIQTRHHAGGEGEDHHVRLLEAIGDCVEISRVTTESANVLHHNDIGLTRGRSVKYRDQAGAVNDRASSLTAISKATSDLPNLAST